MKFFYKLFLTLPFFLNNTLIAADGAISHAPIGVMGDHLHKKNELMFSLRFIQMKMKKNLLNGVKVSDDQILNQPNIYSSMPGMPDNLSIVPNEMTMNMLMTGVMYAPTDEITLMGMAMFTEKKMELSTYSPMMGRNFLGSFNTSASGLSNFSVVALIKLHENLFSRSHFHLGIDKSNGNSNVQGTILTPMNMSVSTTLPYGMQIGDNSLSLSTGLTLVASWKNLIWGSQYIYKSVIDKDEWAFGNKLSSSTWVQKKLSYNFSISARASYVQSEKISGINPSIAGPVQTANPENYGGRVINGAVGINLVTNFFDFSGKDRFAFELVFPIDQDKNGIQMKTSNSLIFGYQRSF